MAVGCYCPYGDKLDGFVDGVYPPFGFFGAGHLGLYYGMLIGMCASSIRCCWRAEYEWIQIAELDRILTWGCGGNMLSGYPGSDVLDRQP